MIFSDRKPLKNIYRSSPRIANRQAVNIRVEEFDGGTNVHLSETRLKPNQAKESTNMMLVEDGVWKKRWGTQQYGGVTFTNRPDGAAEYKKSNGTRELIVVADGFAYVVDPDASTKTSISGATFTQGYACDFVQINNFLYIVNGQDALARYNGTALSTYSAISTPSWAGTPLTRGAGLSTGSYTYYYRVSAVNEVGETLAAAEQSIAVDIEREAWDEADEYIDVDWSAVSGALKYIVYMSDASGYEIKLAEVTTHLYRDDGSATANPYIQPVTEATSAGPVVSSIALVGNRIWATGDMSNLQRVYWTGDGVNLGNFAPGFDGGWVDLETGSRNQCVKVVDFNQEAHVMCKTDDGRGSIWEIDLTTSTIAGESILIPVPTKLIAKMGGPAQRAVVHAENDIFFLNRFGVFTFGYTPNVLNVLQTKEKSTPLRPYIRDSYEPDLGKACGYYYDGKVFFSIPTASGYPNRIFLYDLELGAWEKDWTLGVSQFLEFTDSDDVTHFLGISSDRLIEFSENFEGDQGVAFSWTYTSPKFPVNKDWSRFAYMDRAYVRMRQVRGAIDLSVIGTTFSGISSALGSDTVEQGASDTGVGWDLVGDFKVGTTNGVPTLFAQESLIRYLPVDEWIRDIQWSISGDSLADTAILTGVWADGRIVDTDEPVDWLLS